MRSPYVPLPMGTCSSWHLLRRVPSTEFLETARQRSENQLQELSPKDSPSALLGLSFKFQFPALPPFLLCFPRTRTVVLPAMINLCKLSIPFLFLQLSNTYSPIPCIAAHSISEILSMLYFSEWIHSALFAPPPLLDPFSFSAPGFSLWPIWSLIYTHSKKNL